MLEPHRFPPAGKSLYSLGFRIASWISGCFAVALLLLTPSVSHSLESTKFRGVATFIILAYLFIQFSAATYYHSQTARAGVYFWLLVSFPFWSLPVGVAVCNGLVYVIWNWLS